jgi:Tol biopolymer transport system component
MGRAIRRGLRLTFQGTLDWEPIWSHAGTRVAVASYCDGPSNLYAKPADGAGDAQPLLHSEERKDPRLSPDGRWIALSPALAARRKEARPFGSRASAS